MCAAPSPLMGLQRQDALSRTGAGALNKTEHVLNLKSNDTKQGRIVDGRHELSPTHILEEKRPTTRS